jgi:hypothetical protein
MKTDRFGLGLGPLWWGITLMLSLLYGVWAASDARLKQLVEGQDAIVLWAALGAVFCLALALAAGAIAVILSLATGVGARAALLIGAASPFAMNLTSMSAITIGSAFAFFIAGLAFGSPALSRSASTQDSLN